MTTLKTAPSTAELITLAVASGLNTADEIRAAAGVSPEELLSDAISQLQGRLARMVDNPAGEGPTGAATYIAWLAPEGTPTDDGRFMNPGSLRWREGRLPLMASDRNMPAHLNASFVGNLIDFTRTAAPDGTMWVTATVDWDSDPEAQEWRRMVDEDRIRGVSIDLAVQKARVRDDDAIEDESEDDESLATEWPDGVWLIVEDGIIVGATVVPMPAFAEARVEPEAIAAAEGNIPADWFTIPEFERPTRARRQADGRTAGHGASWGVCHRGRHDVCTTAPRSNTNYALGARGVPGVPGGAIPVYWSPAGDAYAHAPLHLPYWEAIAWYEQHCQLIGFLKTAEDGHGIPTAGYTGPQMDGRHLSGDWRPYPAPAVGEPIAPGHEMIAWSAVDKPGFPVSPGAITAAVEVGRAIVGSAEPSECECHAAGDHPAEAAESPAEAPDTVEAPEGEASLTEALWALTRRLGQALDLAQLEYNRYQAGRSAGFQVGTIEQPPE